MSVFGSGLTWAEGLRWHDGSIWVSDTQGGFLWTNEGGTWDCIPLESQSNGLWFLPDGSLIGSIFRENRLGRWDGKRFSEFVDLSQIAIGPLGDLVGDSHGGLYVDDVGFSAHLGESPRPGRIIYVDADKKPRVAAEGIEFPNGLAIIDEGNTLVVAETWNQRLIAFSVSERGKLSSKRIYADLSVTVNAQAQPDGICSAGKSGVWVSTLSGHSVALLEDGKLVDQVDTGDGFPISCCVAADSSLYVGVASSNGLPVLEAIANRTVFSHVERYDVFEANSRLGR